MPIAINHSVRRTPLMHPLSEYGQNDMLMRD